MPHSFDLLVVGDANPDVVLGPLDAPLAFGQREQLVPDGALTLGGSAAIMACGAARLGLRVAFAGRVGDDDAGRYIRASLDSHGVDTGALHTDPRLPTPLTVVLTQGEDRAIVTAPGTLPATTAADVPAGLLASVRHVHAASYFLLPALAASLPELLATARAHGATTSLDTNDDPSGRWDPPGLDAVLAHTDYLLPNAAEARRLAGLDGADLVESAAALAGRGPTVVVKNGAEGALCHDGGTLVTTPGIPARPVDTVGAGDSFDAGFVAALLAGLALPEALELAAVCGALSTRAHGGTTAQPTWDEAFAQVTRNGKNPA
ncbi:MULTISPECIES: carbohydrate kinase family protein [Streptomyces]|uniref:carbohydrate kinase family protein n=1 Tax=Streptomyces TaxID=1883 RepID=UPI0018854B87|nr:MULTISPECIES: carbohydrate kinase family protein [Streptomyces]MBF8174494.1 carbohydrate kinase family protein [Streptomyces olivaceus]MBZ6129526.1 carbohydrate kinase family protein [Streptomyces olivaceus]MBZ6136026.1 carbohydrate kinase family protein [Streptomyces olivaceus]MBZ6163976.1 carbohydrate kinase family protein [Streptomyces olivaceus]MBZ6170633.1 carbohydrate kinase family protein [Streptomyces olivaceus]